MAGGGESGHAAVELVGVVAAVVLVAVLAIQGITLAQTASVAQEAARHGARARSLDQDWQAVVNRVVPDGFDLEEARAAVDGGTARVHVTVSAPLGVAGVELIDVPLTRSAEHPVQDTDD